MDPYRVLVMGGSGEITEKKSRFIATLQKTDTEEEALAFIEEMRKKYWDAKHNCYAYVLGKNAQITRCSDDGEPGGTAGRPMLEVLLAEKLRNVTVVVTRYFGGILLGTGGLVRAYSQAVKEGLKNCGTGIMTPGAEYRISTDYNDIGKVLYLLGKNGLTPKDNEYKERVLVSVIVAADKEDSFLKELTEVTAGRAKAEKVEELFFVEEQRAEA